MALFVAWRDRGAEPGVAERDLRERVRAASHIVPEREWALSIGGWHVAAFATASAFYAADEQLALDPERGLCMLHGLAWRIVDGAPQLIDAAEMARLLDTPGAPLPADILGEFAILRIHAAGACEAYVDPAGLHQLFRMRDGAPAVANRAAFLAALAGRAGPDRDAALWLGAIGYRVGTGSGWAGVEQVGQAPVAPLDERGFDPALLAEGIDQAKAAVRLAARDGPLDLPITGGKDSRVVLAIALAAGVRERLTLFTRGYAGHPDVVVGAAIADRIGVPHRREPPLGSDLPADLTPGRFLALLRTIAFQGDGGMGGWDNVTALHPGRETLLTGHLGEVLKAYGKHLPDGSLDPVDMVRLQAPFDPLGVLRPAARARLSATLERQMAGWRAAGAEEGDLPDLFYWRNRVPNWLGGIRGIKSFERQPVLPLGVPALMALARRMTAVERRVELAHFRLIEATAPELIDLPFAHQSWHPDLGAPAVAPVLAAADAPLFGSWQWSVNRVPAVRAALVDLFREAEVPLWRDVDRDALIAALYARRFDTLDLISLLGLAVAAIHQAGSVPAARIGGETPRGAEPAIEAIAIEGHLDLAEGAERDGERLYLSDADTIRFSGWLHAPDWPGATVIAEALVDGAPVGSTAAQTARPDLADAGKGDGRYGFKLAVPRSALAGATTLTIAAAGRADDPLARWTLAPDRSAPAGA